MRITNILLIIAIGGIIYLGVKERQRSATLQEISAQIEAYSHRFDIVEKRVDDVQWFNVLGDIAHIDKARIAGPSRHKPIVQNNPFQDSLADNDLVFFTYIFVPKDVDVESKVPLVVFPHGGIHASVSLVTAHTIRELITQGYVVVSPDYRGSTGYGKRFWESIDYGGRENDDAIASRDYVVDNYSFVDPSRVGLMGWSHGGMISLMNLLQHPDKYACAYAGVPVSDVLYRLQYKRESYKDYFYGDYHVGETIEQNPEEYKRRSPANYASLLERPLMITTTENDDDVGVKEVQRMIDSLKHYDKEFEYKIYPPMSGAHVFDRLDTKEAGEIRFLAHKFLEKHLNPPHKFNSVADMRKAAYGFN